jgi:hypothetical protein
MFVGMQNVPSVPKHKVGNSRDLPFSVRT